MDQTWVQCPVCSSAANEQDTRPDEARKFMCRRPGCLEIFRVSRPVEARTPEQVVAREIEAKAAARGIDLESRGNSDEIMASACTKGCGKEFKYEAARNKHEGKCDGTAALPRAPRAKRPRRAFVAEEPVPSNGTMQEAIDLLKKKREQRVQDLIGDDPDVKALDVAIDALENRPT